MILITGATGTNGIEVAKLLSGTGQTFRAMVRSRESAGALTDLPGAELVEADFDDRNSLISAATGQPVSYVDVPENQFREMLAGLGMGAWQADGLVEDYAHYSHGEASSVAPGVKDATGQEPRSFGTLAREYASAFRGDSRKLKSDNYYK